MFWEQHKRGNIDVDANADAGELQAAVAWDAGQELSIEDIEVAPPKANEVRIEIYYTGVCHTGRFGFICLGVMKQILRGGEGNKMEVIQR